MYWNDMVWWAWIPMMTGMILFWGFVAWVVIRLLSSQEAGRGPSESPARQILDARFARGEIGASDFQRARRLLEARR